MDSRDNSANGTRPHSEAAKNNKAETAMDGARNTESPQRLPREFNRRRFSERDQRFYASLALSFIVMYSVGIYFAFRPPKQASAEDYHNLQKKFVAQLLRLDERAPDFPEPTDRQEIISTQAEFVEPTPTPVPAAPAIEKGAPEPPPLETKIATYEERQLGRKQRKLSRAQLREMLSEQVTAIGVLGIITSNEVVINDDTVEDVLRYANVRKGDMDLILQRLRMLGSLNSLEDVADRIGETKLAAARELKGGRIKKVGYEFQERYVADLATAEVKKLERNEEMEEVKPSIAGLGGLGRGKRYTNGSTRTAREVARVVAGHSASIQDCYQSMLRRNPELKGKIVVRFTVSPKGKVVGSSIAESTADSRTLEECILRKVGRWNDFDHCDPSVGNKTYRQIYTFGH